MIDYRSSKQNGDGYNNCPRWGYSEIGMNYNSRNVDGSHMGNYSGSSNSYDVEAKE